MRVGERLSAARILVTGATGFLGQALLERLLSTLPDTGLVLLVRPGEAGGRERVRRLLAQKRVFADLRARLGPGGLDRLLDERIEVVEGDLATATPPLPGDLDVVIHAASTVAFDPPVDVAFRTNLLGTERLYRAVHSSGARPHLVHVSTAYVAGLTKGLVSEASLDHQVDWRAEADAALRARQTAEHASRQPGVLRALTDQARKAHSRAGPGAVADAAEQLRREWVDKRLVDHGRARAQSLGWPDVYTFTKALGERCAEETAASLRLSIVRPSIIESALAHPYPGWIDGFKMADPIILGFGRGEIPDFPGVPDGIIDMIPVDLVVNALLVIAADPPERRTYYHICSGARNPLGFRRLYELVREYFQEHPLTQRDRGEIAVPAWQFRGSRRVIGMLETGERLVGATDRVVSRLPRSRPVREAVRRIDRQRRRLEFIRRYADIYGPYVEAELLYTDDRALELFRSLDPADQREFSFDAAAIDWVTYLQDIHCPSVTRGLRPQRLRPRPPRSAAALHGGDGRVAAVFDMDGTVVAANVIESYLWLRMAERSDWSWLVEAAGVARDLPRYLAAERYARESFLRDFYRRYEGADMLGLRQLVEAQVGELVLRRASPAALRRVREHRAAGHRTVLITGAVEPLTLPLAPLFDEIVAAELDCDENGRCTGFLRTPPLVGEARAGWLRRYAGRVGVSLDASYAYADSHSDLPLLETVGHPVAVSPDVALFRAARRRGWPVEEWRASHGTPRVLLPERSP